MKITVEEKEKTEELKFPCLMKCTNNNDISFVFGQNDYHFHGVYLTSDINCILGLVSYTMVKEYFKPFHGKIILQND